MMTNGMLSNLAAVRDGRMSVESIARGRLELLERENPGVNAVVEYHPDELIAQAREVDQLLDAGKKLTLAGAIITVKDNLNVRGMKSTAGLKKYENNLAQKDSTVIQKLRDEGALILGKTNMPSGAMDVQTDNPVYGRTNHPLFPERTCGGSSGGGACAVRLGISDMDIGNDIMGSIRIPAHFCGIYGFVPTGNAIQLDGFVGGEPMGSTMAQILRIGLQATSVEDILYVLPILLKSGFPEKTAMVGQKLRIAWSDDCEGIPLSKDVGQAFADMRWRLSSDHELYELKSDDFDFLAARECFVKLLYGAIASNLSPGVYFVAKHLMKERFLNNSLKDFLQAENERERCIRQLDSLFERFDCLLVPVSATPAFLHMAPDKTKGSQPVYNSFDVDGVETNYASANLGYTTPFCTSNPVMSMPIGLSNEGLPIGIQVICGNFDEKKLFEIVKRLQVHSVLE